MKTYAAEREFILLSLDQLSLADFQYFLTSGFVIQRPIGCEIWLGIGLNEDPAGIFITHSFYNNQLKRFNPTKLIKTTIDEFEAYCSLFFTEKLGLEPLSDDDEDFCLDLEQILDWFKIDQKLLKVVAVTTCTYKLTNNAHPLSQLSSMQKLEGSVYGFWDKGRGVIGVSPEPLFMKEGIMQGKESWMTRSLAGTISCESEQHRDTILNDPKEIIEHNLVTKDIIEKLTPYVFEIKAEKTKVVPFGKIAHLQTNLSFLASHLSASKLMMILGPTAALGGFPQSLSSQYLRKLNYYQQEKEERQFGGSIGFEYEDEAFALVGIRNLYWDSTSKKGIIHSGGGIVKESMIENELNEVRSKREVIRSLFDSHA